MISSGATPSPLSVIACGTCDDRHAAGAGGLLSDLALRPRIGAVVGQVVLSPTSALPGATAIGLAGSDDLAVVRLMVEFPVTRPLNYYFITSRAGQTKLHLMSRQDGRCTGQSFPVYSWRPAGPQCHYSVLLRQDCERHGHAAATFYTLVDSRKAALECVESDQRRGTETAVFNEGGFVCIPPLVEGAGGSCGRVDAGLSPVPRQREVLMIQSPLRQHIGLQRIRSARLG